MNERDEQIEAICQARCTIPGIRWDDGMTEGVARIEQMLAERCLDALDALSAPTNPATLPAPQPFFAGNAQNAEMREAIARLIDPDAWHHTIVDDGTSLYWTGRRNLALTKADAILGLIATSAVDGRETLGEALFVLSDRLRADGFLGRLDHHAVYERVVAAFNAPVALSSSGGEG